MPWCFRSNFGLSFTSIIDCFELFIEKPGDLLCHAATWSQYKHYNNTAKYLLSVTPQGLLISSQRDMGVEYQINSLLKIVGIKFYVNFNLKMWCLLTESFNVEDSIAYRGATLNIPAFTRDESQLNPKDVKATRKIANVRIHVERVIGAVHPRFKNECQQQSRIIW